MALNLRNRIDDIKGSLQRISSRERAMLGGLAGAFVIAVVFVVGYLIVTGLEGIEARNEAMRQAIQDLARNRACYTEHRRRNAQLEVRLSRTPLELNRYVETAASEVGVSIAESGEISPIAGDRFTQRGVEIKLRKISIGELARLIKELEDSPHIVQITRLNVSTRWKQHEELEVEMVVSTFERSKREQNDKSARGRRRRGRS